MQAIKCHAHSGWREEETRLLFDTVRAAGQEGAPLREVFAQVGEQLGRRPNSIRNYYYARVREEPDDSLRKSGFSPFTEEELRTLLRAVLLARAEGMSVRACVTRLADGDRSRMLRYQNKYRSVLRGKPELLERVAGELRAEGLPCPESVDLCVGGDRRMNGLYQNALRLSRETGDGTLAAMLEGLNRLLERAAAPVLTIAPEPSPAQESAMLAAKRDADRLRVQSDLQRLAMEERDTAHRAVLEPLHETLAEFMGLTHEQRAAELAEFSRELAPQVTSLQELLEVGRR